MKNNNAGFSLVELIVTLAMLTILTAVGAYGIGQLTGFRARETADAITSSITENKIATLGKAKASGAMAWELYKKDGDFYVCTVYDAGMASESRSEAKQVNDGKVNVFIGKKVSGSPVVEEMADDEVYHIYFNRSTGAVCDSSGASVDYNPFIKVTYGQKEYEIEVISKTGKVLSNSRK